MSLSPLDGVGMLWQFTCAVFGAVLTARPQREPAKNVCPTNGQPAAKVSARLHRRRSEPRALAVTPPSGHVTGTFPYAVGKRVFDIVFGAACLVAAAPLMGAIALAIALTLGRPILFSQQRVGRGGRLFRLYKFRTLERRPVARSEVEWSAAASHPFTAFLRRSGLDELPQLIHVLRGEMSLVGPRPERPHFVGVFEQGLPHYTARHHLETGITGWAQVHGLRGDTPIRQRLEHDLFYLKHWSLGLDLRILLLTLQGLGANLWAVARGRPSESYARRLKRDRC